MPFTLPEGTFPPLKISPSAEKDFATEAERIIFDTIEASETFYAGEKRLDRRQWKRIRSQENFKVYKQRVVPPREPKRRFSILEPRFLSGSLTSNSSLDEMTEESPIGKPPHIPMIVMHGSVDGKLDDVLYGICASDYESWRIQNVYLDDKLDEARILAKLQGPSEVDPFRSLNIKWFIRSHERESIVSLIHRRDYLVLEATGLAMNSKGQRVSFMLMHSIRLPQIRTLEDMNVTRGSLSICYICHQATPTTVEMYCRAFSDSGGKFPVGLTAHYAAKSFTAAVNVIECSYMKKMMWLMRKARHSSQENAANGHSSECKTCRRSVNKPGTTFGSDSLCRSCREVSLN